jgi:hypothetical protein
LQLQHSLAATSPAVEKRLNVMLAATLEANIKKRE